MMSHISFLGKRRRMEDLEDESVQPTKERRGVRKDLEIRRGDYCQGQDRRYQEGGEIKPRSFQKRRIVGKHVAGEDFSLSFISFLHFYPGCLLRLCPTCYLHFQTSPPSFPFHLITLPPELCVSISSEHSSVSDACHSA